MSEEVRRVVLATLMTFSGLPRDDVEKYVEEMKLSDRYVEEIFGGHT